eukprot:jgi/Undpi1/7396/HiC_scaffold_22.g09869.m1
MTIPETVKIRKACKKWLKKKELKNKEELRASQRTAPTVSRTPVPTKTLEEIYCPNNIAPQLIGKGGVHITLLMRETKATIVVKQYYDKSASDVVISGAPANVAVAKRRVEDFYRLKGCDPDLLPPPSGGTLMPAKRKTAPPATAAGRGGGAATAARARPPDHSGNHALRGHVPAQPSVRGGGGGGGGGGSGGGGGGGVGVVEDGAWGGELRKLLEIAGCLHHLDRFRTDQLDGESLQLMERRDFAKMGVTEVRSLGLWSGAGCGAVRCGAVRCGAVRCGAVRCGAVRCGAVRCGAVRCGAVRCGAVRCGAVRCGAMRCGAVRCGAVRCGAVRCGAVRCGAVRCGAVRCGAVRCGAVRCGAVRCGAVRCGAVRCGAVRCGVGAGRGGAGR